MVGLRRYESMWKSYPLYSHSQSRLAGVGLGQQNSVNVTLFKGVSWLYYKDVPWPKKDRLALSIALNSH